MSSKRLLALAALALLASPWASAQAGPRVGVGIGVGVGAPYAYRPYYGHGYGYGYGYYPYWGYWPSFSFNWYYPYGYGYGYPYSYGYPYYYGDPGYYDGGGYGGGYGGGGGYDEGGYDVQGYNGGGAMGALDLDIAPGQTHVFVNGRDLGEVDHYDGWPGYLWLPRGTYDVAFYLNGYKTVSRQVSIYPGSVIDLDDRMEQGPSIRPEDLVTKSHQRRDERLQHEKQLQEQPPPPDHQNGGYDQNGAYENGNWQDRVRVNRERAGYAPGNSRGHLRLTVAPEDASVYLDGQFVCTGTDLSLLRGGLAGAPGSPRLAVVRPGHKATEKEFTVNRGEDVQLDISLDSGS